MTLSLIYMKVGVTYTDLSTFFVGYVWQLICQVSPWLFLQTK